MWIYLAILLLSIILIYVLVVYNSLVRSKNKIDNTFLEIDENLKKWWDLVPNFINTVKKYAIEEKDDLEAIIKTRNCLYKKMSKKEKDEVLTELLNMVFKVRNILESKTSISNNENYKKSSLQLKLIEREIMRQCDLYNGYVQIYNGNINKFPYNILSKFLRIQGEELILQSLFQD